jgi:hypothetical protein
MLELLELLPPPHLLLMLELLKLLRGLLLSLHLRLDTMRLDLLRRLHLLLMVRSQRLRQVPGRPAVADAEAVWLGLEG